MIKVLLVDDHDIIRDGIKALLHGNKDIEVIGECKDGDEVLDFVSINNPDVILMDVNMRIMSGIEATELISEKFPKIKILVLTMHTQESYISKILKAGALGYVLKSTGKEELITAINTVYKGESYFTSDVSDIMMSRFMKKPKNVKKSVSLVDMEDLTKREIEILKLIAEEMTNTAISEQLFISPRTVDTHRRNLLQKLGVKNTAGLVKFAIYNKLVD